jgi:diaminopropionate ammonia-lyase
MILLSNPNSIFYYTGLTTPGTAICYVLITKTQIKMITRDLEATNLQNDQLDIEVIMYKEENPRIILKSQLQDIYSVVYECMNIDINMYQRIRWVDMQQEITLLRIIKDEYEVQHIKNAATFVCDAYKLALQKFKIGMRENQLAAWFSYGKMMSGSVWTSYPEFIASGVNGCRGHFPASCKQIVSDELVFMEIGGCENRYHAARMHTVFTGVPPLWFIEMEKSIRSAVNKVVRVVKPGMPLCCIDKLMRDIIENTFTNSTIDHPPFQMLRRSGYSIGIGSNMDWTDGYILINPTCKDILQENMSLHIMPWCQFENFGAIGFSDTVIVEKDGFISCFPSALQSSFPTHAYSFENKHVDLNSIKYERIKHTNTSKTPLINIKDKLNLYLKDERKRMNTRSFKIIGVMYAVKTLIEQGKLHGKDIVATMSDGNHGEALAHVARHFGLHCVVLLPSNVKEDRKTAIKKLGATIQTIDGSYDDCIQVLQIEATNKNWKIISDTSWNGYTEIPKLIMKGYTQLFDEILEEVLPTHLFVQTGVGGLLSAACLSMPTSTNIICVEPVDAACLCDNIRKGRTESNLEYCSGTTNSEMQGLNCGIPSKVSYTIIQKRVNHFLAIGDDWSFQAMKWLHKKNIDTSASGSASLAGLLCASKRKMYDMTKESRVVVLVTEDVTDIEQFKRICH